MGSSYKWLESEGLSNCEEAAVMFEGATGAVEKENELLRKHWPQRDIESAGREFRAREIEGLQALLTQTKTQPAVGRRKSILKKSDVTVMPCFNNEMGA